MLIKLHKSFKRSDCPLLSTHGYHWKVGQSWANRKRRKVQRQKGEGVKNNIVMGRVNSIIDNCWSLWGFSGEGNGNPLQCSCLENPRDGGAWWAADYGVTQSWTRLKRLSRSSSGSSRIMLIILFLFLYWISYLPVRLPWWLRQQKICLQCRRPGFDLWVRKIPWRRKWQPIPVLLPGKFHGQRSLLGNSPWNCKESDTTEQLHFHFHKEEKICVDICEYAYMQAHNYSSKTL